MYCIRCGTKIDEGSRYCPSCGALQAAAGSASENKAAKNRASSGSSTQKTVKSTNGTRQNGSGNRTGKHPGSGAAAGKQSRQSAPRQSEQKSGSASRSFAVVIISIFAIAAAAAAVIFVLAKTKENAGSADLKTETAVVSESESTRDNSQESGNIKDLFGLGNREEQEASEETGDAENVQEAGSASENVLGQGENETAEPAAENAEDNTTITETPEPEAVPVTASVGQASKASLGSYQKVKISSAAATSELKQEDQPEIDNSANSAVDGDVTTSWQESVNGYGEGQYLDLHLNKEYKIRAITFNMGNWRTQELYNDNSRPKEITLWLDDQSFTVTIPDGMTQYCVEFSGPVKASEVMVVINSVYAGRMWDDTCISEITLYAQ